MPEPRLVSGDYEVVPIERVKPHPRNPRRGDLERIGASIAHNGFYGAVVVQRSTGHILVGNHRWMAAKEAGLGSIPVVWTDADDEAALRILLADNRTADEAGYDDPTLAALLAELARTDASLSGTGWRQDELEALLIRVTGDRAGADLDHLPPLPTEPVTQPGDLWHLGAHRLYCGDASDPASYRAVLAGEHADLVFTSPPYNVGKGYSSHDDKPVPWPEYSEFLEAVLAELRPHLAQGRALCWNVGVSPKTHHFKQMGLLEELGFAFHRQLVWQKTGVPLPLFHNTEGARRARVFTPDYTHELVAVFSRDQADDEPELLDPERTDPTRALAVFTRRPFDPVPAHELVAVFVNGKKLRKGDRVAFGAELAHDVFTVNQTAATVDVPAGERGKDQGGLDRRSAKAHPATFPVALPEGFIRHLADVGTVVLDPFCGAGSTLLAAARTGRRGAGVEIDPSYVDVACLRYQQVTGDHPVLVRGSLMPRSIDFTAGDG
jgi:DNA modification methylase